VGLPGRPVPPTLPFPVLILTVIQGPDRGRKFELPSNEPQLIGRSSEALPIRDNTVSRRHAELTPDEGQWYIRDLTSQNGTYLNGVRLSERARLKGGDQIRVGSTLFVFGKSDAGDEFEFVRLARPAEMDTSVERTLASNEDSVILAEPEPRAAAVDHLRIIYKLTTLTTRTMEKQQLLRAVMDLAFNEFHAERGFIMLCDGPAGFPRTEPLRPAVVKYKKPPLDRDSKQINVSRTILNHAIRKGEGVLSTNAMTDPRFAKGDSVQRLHIRSAICSPIKFHDRTFGAIYIDSSLANYTFTDEQLSLMNAIGQHTGLALGNAELYQQKLQSERLAAIGETVASLSHSIKNILQGLRGGADVVEMGLKKDDLKIAKGGWEILKRNLDRIVSLTLNMLAFSRQRTVQVELTRLGPMLEECAQLLEGQCNARQVALIVDADPEMPPIPIDPSLIHQAIMNLMTNAVEAVQPEAGIVTARATYHPAGSRGDGSPASAEIAVIDNGPGIPEDRRNRIFEPFQTTKGTRGTGLGLAVTKRIVEEHRGLLRLESAEGQGTTFRLILPADSGQVIDPSATAAAQAGSLGFDLTPPF
jgi:two-component system, NtrC family, sensor kinase